MPDEPSCVRCYVEGRVQRVFFRASTAQIAQRLGLTGWARNLPDGRVEVVACGAPQALDELCEWLWEGPAAASVSEVRIEHCEEAPPPRFEVR